MVTETFLKLRGREGQISFYDLSKFLDNYQQFYFFFKVENLNSYWFYAKNVLSDINSNEFDFQGYFHFVIYDIVVSLYVIRPNESLFFGFWFYL